MGEEAEDVDALRPLEQAGDKGERPPWYLNPLITFPAIFAVVGLGFYLVVELGGVHRGTPAPIGDDLRGFLDETPLP